MGALRMALQSTQPSLGQARAFSRGDHVFQSLMGMSYGMKSTEELHLPASQDSLTRSTSYQCAVLCCAVLGIAVLCWGLLLLFQSPKGMSGSERTKELVEVEVAVEMEVEMEVEVEVEVEVGVEVEVEVVASPINHLSARAPCHTCHLSLWFRMT